MATGRRNGDGVGAGAGRAARRGLSVVARVVALVTSVVVGLILLGILLVVLEANRDNQIVDWLLSAAEFLVEPFDNFFEPERRKVRIAVNWGLAAVIYGIVGGVIVRLLRR